MRSRSLTIVSCLGVFALGVVVATAASLPAPVVVIPTAGIIVGLLVNHQNLSRRAGAVAQDPSALETYAVTIPARRVAPGRAMQLKFSPAMRKVFAPGLLCAAPGRLGFIPSRPKDAPKRWEGAVDGVSLARTLNETTVRVRGADGPVQFVINLPRDKVETALAPYLPVEAT